MFACLSQLVVARPGETGATHTVMEVVARDFSPRVEVHRPGLVSLDIAGLRRLLGTPETIGRELQKAIAARDVVASIAVAATRTASLLLALGRPGLTVVPPGAERRQLAGLPLSVLARVPAVSATGPARHTTADPEKTLDLFRRWGLKTLGDLAALPVSSLAARIGQDGPAWQRLARGEDLEPLLAMPPEEPISESLELEWPVEGLEPLSFVLARVIEPVCERLASLDQAAIVLRLSFRLASKDTEQRVLELPAPMRDPKVLRTLVLLHLESHPLPSGVDRLTLLVEPSPARVVQFSLLKRALPFPEQMATLLARLGALMGERRVGAADVVDSYRPGIFDMKAFTVAEGTPRYDAGRGAGGAGMDGGLPRRSSPRVVGARSDLSAIAPDRRREQGATAEGGTADGGKASFPRVVLSRYRLPVPARVAIHDGRPARVTTERRGLEGGRVEAAAGPWRTSGEWWRVPDARVQTRPDGSALQVGWSRDEWDVALSDGAIYRIYRDRAHDRWFVDGICD